MLHTGNCNKEGQLAWRWHPAECGKGSNSRQEAGSQLGEKKTGLLPAPYIDPDGDAHGDGMSSYALRDIAAGEELTDDYALYDKLPWFEAICQERGVTGSCTEVGRQFD